MDSVHFQVLFSKEADFEKIIKENIINVSEENNNLVSEENIEKFDLPAFFDNRMNSVSNFVETPKSN